MSAPHPAGWEVHRGYSWPGLEKVSNAVSSSPENATTNTLDDRNGQLAADVAALRGIQDVKESFDIGSDNNSSQPNVWPPEELYPGFRSFMTRFYETLHSTAAIPILQALALGLGCADEDTFVKLHSSVYNQLRLLHYPSIPVDEVEDYDSSDAQHQDCDINGDTNSAANTTTNEKRQKQRQRQKKARMPPHTDWSTITLLFQDSIGGLEVEIPGRKGEFMPVPPLEHESNALVMNVGDLMMRWSNDRLKSTGHRVGLPPSASAKWKAENGGGEADRKQNGEGTGIQNGTQARYSIPYFLTTDPDEVIECLVLGQGEKAKYEPITQREYGAMRARMQY